VPTDRRSVTKGGVQICVVFPFQIEEDMRRIVETERNWLSVNEFIREAVKEKVGGMKGSKGRN
jgi:Arc/MetJ-type ribon-helix-helix transcriptional regulator